MAKKSKIILAVLLALASFGTFKANMNSVYADDNERAAVHLQVSPTKQKLSLEPGSSYVGTFKVMNIGLLPFTYNTYATPYQTVGDNYDADYATINNYTQIADWITFDASTKTGTLQPDETVEVSFTVNVPKDAPAGGQYAALMAETDAGNAEDANIKVVHRVGMILYATVPGETRGTGEIIKNSINSFYFTPPLSVSSLVKNTGNIELTATYTVNVWPLFSKESVFSNEEQPQTLDIMPETSRFNSIAWEGSPKLGIFKVKQVIEFAGEVSTNEKLVLICPLWLLFLIFAILFFMIFWLVSRARERKRIATNKKELL